MEMERRRLRRERMEGVVERRVLDGDEKRLGGGEDGVKDGGEDGGEDG
jgi:hypothetical protein